jgi:hypothetical protein
MILPISASQVLTIISRCPWAPGYNTVVDRYLFFIIVKKNYINNNNVVKFTENKNTEARELEINSSLIVLVL